MELIADVYYAGYLVDRQDLDIPLNMTKTAAVEAVRGIVEDGNLGMYYVEFLGDGAEVVAEHAVSADADGSVRVVYEEDDE